MTRSHFRSIVGLRLRAFGVQPPSELTLGIGVATTGDAGDMSPVTFGRLGIVPSKGPYDENFVFDCAECALVTDETFWDHETYTCMTHLRGPRVTFYSRGPSKLQGPHGLQTY